ncbi:MAG: hypothetical protein D6B27_08525 [Gammaproteobacteria bacterium]|mgnify:CR=1 FL=1|nr:MAG: hypothetical protein D6B27_08525 [Gammaproteobacteria bacterium]
MEKVKSTLTKAVFKLLRPLVHILLKNDVPYSAFTQIAKHVYVDVATNDFKIEGRKQTVSRVAIITGLSRKEVARVQEIDQPEVSEEKGYNRAVKVIRGWVADPRFMDDSGAPRELSFDEGEYSFIELVRLYSGDVPGRAMLDELKRVGAVNVSADNLITLSQRSYIPKQGETEKIEIMGDAAADLIGTIKRNLDKEGDNNFFQQTVAYDNLPKDKLKEIRALSNMQLQTCMELVNTWLAQYDRDVNKEVEGEGKMRAGVGLYYFEEKVEERFDEKLEEKIDEDNS